MAARKSREIRLKSRPNGMPTLANFELAEVEVGDPGPGQVLVRNSYMTVDPYMRGRMMDRRSYVPPFQIGEAMTGGAVGQVVAAGAGAPFKVGDHVQSMAGWREWFVSTGMEMMQKIEPIPGVGIQSFLGALGMPGLTAYAGLLKIGEFKPEDSVFVSAASGAVGAVVCQIAKAKGSKRVVGSAGSDEKCAWLKKIGCDEAINYKTCGDLTAAVAKAFPDGIGVYFDNVGGSHLEAALANMRQYGRLAECGMIEQYNAVDPPPGPRNMILVVGLSLTMRGFIVSNHFDMVGDFMRDMGEWIKAGKMTWKETIYDGLERAPEAFLGLFKGENFGKMLVRVGPDKAV
ncbi:MAG: NADP-dependent oxidoreductase [Alphaproteobacteria bacterium]|nr:NADP-dependent oxidoreductase [Alphaproteobacteria bacterium]MBV9693778.1 NADP-dependent oxidoreductase [Alphaproteobacteria bacterium]